MAKTSQSNTSVERWKRLRRYVRRGGVGRGKSHFVVEAAVRMDDGGPTGKLKHIEFKGSKKKIYTEREIDRVIEFLKDVKGEL